MKSIFLIPTGETRRANQGEYYFRNGDYLECVNYTEYEYPIFTRHEIELPDAAKQIDFNFFSEKDWDGGYTPIPKPKRKVKKWRWVNAVEGRLEITVSHYHDQSEYTMDNKNYPGQLLCQIPGTEIEVDE